MGRYEIIYDYTDEVGNEYRNCYDTFEGSWDQLQEYIKALREHGCYRIDATCIADLDENGCESWGWE